MHRHYNRLKTAVLLTVLTGFMLVVGAYFGGQTGLYIAFAIALATNGFSYFYSDKLALRSMRAYEVSSHDQPVMHRIVQDLAQQAGQPMPRLYMSPTAAPNAFATGRNPQNAAVCCTEGIMQLLDERELRGVLGHELSHVYNRDILIASVAATVASVIMFLVQFAWLIPSGDGGRRNPLVGLLIFIIGPIAASVIQMAISRTREFDADQSGAELTGDPLALASALRKLELGAAAAPLPPEPELQTTSALMIANPFGGAAGMSRLFSTHPPTAERIARLEGMANAGPR